MTNLFDGKTVEWLLARRSALQDALASGAGAQNHAAIAPGMFHEFADMSQKELKDQLLAVRYALWCEDPNNYADPRREKIMRVITVHGGGYFDGNCV